MGIVSIHDHVRQQNLEELGAVTNFITQAQLMKVTEECILTRLCRAEDKSISSEEWEPGHH